MAASAQNTLNAIDHIDQLPSFDELKAQTKNLVAQAEHAQTLINHHFQIAETYRDQGNTKIALGFMQKAAKSISEILDYEKLAKKDFNEVTNTFTVDERREINSVIDGILQILYSAEDAFNRRGRTLNGSQIKLKNTVGQWDDCTVRICKFDERNEVPLAIQLENNSTNERTELAITDNFDERLRDTDEIVQDSRNAVKLALNYGPAEKEIMSVINRFPATGAIGTIDTSVSINGGLSDTHNTYTHFTFSDRDVDQSLEAHEKAFFHPSHQFTVETKRVITKETNGAEKITLQVIGIEPVGFSIHPKFQKDLNTSFIGKELTEEVATQITERLLFLHQHGIQPDQIREKEAKATKLGWFNSSSTDRRVARLSDPNSTLAEDDEKTAEVRARHEAEAAGITAPSAFAHAMNWFGKTKVGKLLPSFLFANSAIAVGGTTDTEIVNRTKPEKPTEPSTPTGWDKLVQKASGTFLGKWFPSLFANNKLIMAAANTTPPADNSDIAVHTPDATPTKINKKRVGIAGLAAAAVLAALFGIRHANQGPELPQDASMGLLSNEGSTDDGTDTDMVDAGIAARQAAQTAQTDYANAVAAHGARSPEALIAATTVMDAGTAERVVAANEADASFAAMDALQVAQANYANAIESHGAQSTEAKAAATAVKNAHDTQQNVLAAVAAANDTTAIGNGTINNSHTLVATPTQNNLEPAAIVLPVGTDSGDVNGGTAAHPDRHNDSLERFFVHGASQVIQLANTGLTPAQETRAAGAIGHLLQQHTDTYLAAHPSQAHRFGQIHHGDHGNMVVELATRPHGHGTQEVFHIQLHRADRHNVDHIVLDLNIPRDQINNVLHSHGRQGISHDSHANGHRLINRAGHNHRGQQLHISETAGHTSGTHTNATVRTTAPTGRNERAQTVHVATPVVATVDQPTANTVVDGGTQQSALPAAAVATNTRAPQAAQEALTNTDAVVHPEPQNQPHPGLAPAAQPASQESVRPAAGEAIGRVASAHTVERTIDSFHQLTAYQKQALGDFILAFNEHTPSLHRQGSTEEQGSIAASISYDSTNRATLNIDIVGMPGTVRQRQIRAELPFTVVRRADGYIDLETDDRPVVLPRASETTLRSTVTTSRRMIPTLGSVLTGDESLMAREEFRPDRSTVGPVDSVQDINAIISPSIAGFGIEPATNPDDGFHLEQQNAGVYSLPRVGAHTPMARVLAYVLGQVRHVTLTPALTITDHHGNEVINPATTVTVVQPFATHPNTTNAVISAFVNAVRDHLNTRPFQTTPRTTTQPARTPDAAQPTLTHTADPVPPHSDPLDGLGDLGLKAERTITNSDHDIAIATDTAAYDALIKNISDHFGHTDPSQQA